MHPALQAVGQTYRDFQIVKHTPLEELQSTLVELVHIPTGARILHIANQDPENLFCLSFQTLPSNSNGVAHILEHTVLCGSQKFPVKDPFFAMTRRSLNTYMNALTGQDFTCYPASSQVEKDFYNLLEVYLDAVFHPELKKNSFLQEGHRLEFVDSQNPKGPLQYQGIVYNEMKGAMSSLDSRLWQALSKHLTPDLPYAHNSGGDPKEIPSLSYEELVEFHQNFYHPSRCLFFFYGNLPLAKHLDFLTERAFSGVQKIAPLPPLALQKRHTAPLQVTDRYPIAEGESVERKAMVTFSWLTVPILQQASLLALCLIDSILTDTDASPLKMALLKSGLCTEVDSSIDIEMSEVPWSITCKGCDPKDAEALKKILFDSLREAASKPFAEKDIEASLHQLEFQRMEIGSESIPFGLTLFMRAGLLKQHGGEPEQALLIHSLFNDLRQRLKDPTYLPSLLKHHVIDNPHFVQLLFLPDPNLSQEELQQEQAQLASIRSRLTEEQENQILKQTEQLAAYQEEVEHQSLDCLPSVTLADVPLHSVDFTLQEYDTGTLKVFHHDTFTNHILYADLVFDLPLVSQEDLSLVSLFMRLLPELGCGGRSYAETLAYQQAYIGGCDASLSLYTTFEDPDQSRPALSLRGKALYHNSEKLLHYFFDLVTSADFTDRERIQEWLSQHATALQNRLTKNSLNYAVQTALSEFSNSSYVYNQWHGLPYYQSVMQWAKRCDESLLKELQRIQSQLLGLKKPHLILGCDQAHFETLRKNQFYGLSDRLPQQSYAPWQGKYQLPKVEPQVRWIASPVAFTALAMRTISHNHPDAPYLYLSTELFANTYLHKEIREKGGAYGSGASYAPSLGNFYFYSYRDPHLTKTTGTFRKALEKIAAGHFTERDLEEAKLGVIQTLDSPVSPASRASSAYTWKRSGQTHSHRENFRKKILQATLDQVSQSVKTYLLSQEGLLISFLGKDLWEKEKKKIKISLKEVPILSSPEGFEIEQKN